jgi:hypothetical protein
MSKLEVALHAIHGQHSADFTYGLGSRCRCGAQDFGWGWHGDRPWLTRLFRPVVWDFSRSNAWLQTPAGEEAHIEARARDARSRVEGNYRGPSGGWTT